MTFNRRIEGGLWIVINGFNEHATHTSACTNDTNFDGLFFCLLTHISTLNTLYLAGLFLDIIYRQFNKYRYLSGFLSAQEKAQRFHVKLLGLLSV